MVYYIKFLEPFFDFQGSKKDVHWGTSDSQIGSQTIFIQLKDVLYLHFHANSDIWRIVYFLVYLIHGEFRYVFKLDDYLQT